MDHFFVAIAILAGKAVSWSALWVRYGTDQ